MNPIWASNFVHETLVYYLKVKELPTIAEENSAAQSNVLLIFFLMISSTTC